MIVVAFHTSKAQYRRDAQMLRRCLARCGMEYDIEDVGDAADWYAATAMKAPFLARMRAKHTGPMLYIDVDAAVHENCADYFEGLDADFGCHYFQGPAGGYDKTANANRLLSGTLWFADNQAARDLLQTWCELNELLRSRGLLEGGGQKNLWFLTTCMKDLRIATLPGRYCYVFDKPWAYPDGEPRIIEHTIASRENRGRSSWEPHAGRQTRLRELEANFG